MYLNTGNPEFTPVRFVLATMFDSLKLMRLWSWNILEIILSVLFLQMRKLKQDIMAYLGDINWWNFTGNQLLEFSVDLFFSMIFSYVYSIKLPLIWKKKKLLPLLIIYKKCWTVNIWSKRFIKKKNSNTQMLFFFYCFT